MKKRGLLAIGVLAFALTACDGFGFDSFDFGSDSEEETKDRENDSKNEDESEKENEYIDNRENIVGYDYYNENFHRVNYINGQGLYEDHIFGEPVITGYETNEAGTCEMGYIECTRCHYQRYDYKNYIHEHTFGSSYSYNDLYHWIDCECHPEYQMEYCGHSLEAWQTEYDNSGNPTGYEIRKCFCGYSFKRIANDGHLFEDVKTVTTDGNSTYSIKSCKTCGNNHYIINANEYTNISGTLKTNTLNGGVKLQGNGSYLEYSFYLEKAVTGSLYFNGYFDQSVSTVYNRGFFSEQYQSSGSLFNTQVEVNGVEINCDNLESYYDMGFENETSSKTYDKTVYFGEIQLPAGFNVIKYTRLTSYQLVLNYFDIVDSPSSHIHSYSEWQLDNSNPNYIFDKRTCSTCGFTSTKNHSHRFTYGAFSQNDSSSHIANGVCECGETTILSEAHEYSEWTTIGNTEKRTCSVCSYEQIRINNDHNLTVLSTYSEGDSIQYDLCSCSTCGKSHIVIRYQTIIDSLTTANGNMIDINDLHGFKLKTGAAFNINLSKKFKGSLYFKGFINSKDALENGFTINNKIQNTNNYIYCLNDVKIEITNDKSYGEMGYVIDGNVSQSLLIEFGSVEMEKANFFYIENQGSYRLAIQEIHFIGEFIEE